MSFIEVFSWLNLDLEEEHIRDGSSLRTSTSAWSKCVDPPRVLCLTSDHSPSRKMETRRAVLYVMEIVSAEWFACPFRVFAQNAYRRMQSR
eukprot:747597-Hanusia_phi.AAC.4